MGRKSRGGVRARKDDYQLLRIADAHACLNQRVNLMGVIVEHSLPRKSKGTDFWCTVKIVDKSCPSCGIVVNFFAESMNMLPKIESAEDIILITQVVIRFHHGNISASFSKKYSAFALYEGEHSQSFTPYRVSSKFCTREQHKEFVADLRTWRKPPVPNETKLLKFIQKGEQVNLVCKILHMCQDNQGKWMLFVWDGTDAPPCHIQQKLCDEMENPLPLQLEGERLSRDILSKFPTVGTVLRVKVQLGVDLSTSIVGRWVKLTSLDLELQVSAGLWYGIFTLCSRITHIQDGESHVLNCLSDFNVRLSSKWDRMPSSSFPCQEQVTEFEAKHVALVTLMDIINFSQVTAMFQCVVRTVTMLPSDPKDFCCPNGIYRIRVTLEDPTARIHAYLYAEDAETFFNGYPGIDRLTRMRNKLLGIAETDSCSEANDDAPRNPPWMLCGIKSYYVDENDMVGSRRFRIFGTKLSCV